MRPIAFLVVAVLVWFPLFAQNQIIKSTPGGSAGDSFIVSPGNAKAALNCGIKIVHAVIPTNGFGNTVTTNGGCTYDPSLSWTFTKKTTVISWTTNLGPSVRGWDMATQQSNSIGTNTVNPPDPGVCDPTYWDGYNTISNIGYYTFSGECGTFNFCLWDRTTETNFPTDPGTHSTTVNSQNVSTWLQHFHTNGSTLSVVNTSVGTLTNLPSLGSFDNSTNASNLYGFTNINSFSISHNTTSTNWTETSSGERWYVSFFSYLSAYPCAFGGGNPLSTKVSFTQTKTITYSDPVYFNADNQTASNLLAKVNLLDSGERYALFDQINVPVILRWNPITNPFSGLTIYIYRREVVGGVISGAFDFSSRIYLHSYWPSTNGPAMPYYVDTTGAEYGKEYAYKVQLDYSGPFKSYSWTNYVSGISKSPCVLPALPFYSYTNQSTNAPAFNPVATNLYWLLPWSTMAYATNKPVEIAVFPVTNGAYVLSTSVSNAKSNAPTMLSASAMPVGTGRVSFGVSGVSGIYWSKSYGFVVGNSPSNTPPVTNCWEQKIYFTNAPGGSTGLVDLTTNYLNGLSFPRGRLGGFMWQSSKPLRLSPADCLTNGFIFYR